MLVIQPLAGRLVTEFLKDYIRKTLAKENSSLEDFLHRWSKADKNQAIFDELTEDGIFFEALPEEVGRNCDLFDLVCHVAWDMPPLTRRECAEKVKKRIYFRKYSDQDRRVLADLLDKYADEEIAQIEQTQILTISPFTKLDMPMEIICSCSRLGLYQQAVHDSEQAKYYSTSLPPSPASFPRRRESRKDK